MQPSRREAYGIDAENRLHTFDFSCLIASPARYHSNLACLFASVQNQIVMRRLVLRRCGDGGPRQGFFFFFVFLNHPPIPASRSACRCRRAVASRRCFVCSLTMASDAKSFFPLPFLSRVRDSVPLKLSGRRTFSEWYIPSWRGVLRQVVCGGDSHGVCGRQSYSNKVSAHVSV
ncbi:hypothetical protein H4582DRAFT_1098909 [Lactarius indigo]|nr:hypothetical protein H4582DRAFT_1098909 [Lactarius indigo]